MKDKPDVVAVGPIDGSHFQGVINNSNSDHSTVTKSITIWNNSKYSNVIAIFRDNMKVVLAKTLGSVVNFDGLIIKEQYTMPHRLLELSKDYINFNNVSGINVDQWEILKKEATKALEFNSGMYPYRDYSVHLNIITLVPEIYLDEYKHIYLHSKDIVFSTDSIMDSPDHPYNTDDIAIENYKRLINSEVSFLIGIDIVDNSQSVNDKWVFIAGEARKIAPRKDNDKQEGVYIFTRDISTCKIEHLYNELTDINKTILFDTKEEALTSGDPQLIEKKRISKLEKKLKKEKAEKELEKAKMAAEAKEKELEHARKLAKINTTKDTIKLIGGIALAALSAYAAYMKFKSIAAK